jgi:hypothetical protein
VSCARGVSGSGAPDKRLPHLGSLRASSASMRWGKWWVRDGAVEPLRRDLRCPGIRAGARGLRGSAVVGCAAGRSWCLPRVPDRACGNALQRLSHLPRTVRDPRCVPVVSGERHDNGGCSDLRCPRNLVASPGLTITSASFWTTRCTRGVWKFTCSPKCNKRRLPKALNWPTDSAQPEEVVAGSCETSRRASRSSAPYSLADIGRVIPSPARLRGRHWGDGVSHLVAGFNRIGSATVELVHRYGLAENRQDNTAYSRLRYGYGTGISRR